jgi:hypothetical protein
MERKMQENILKMIEADNDKYIAIINRKVLQSISDNKIDTVEKTQPRNELKSKKYKTL